VLTPADGSSPIAVAGDQNTTQTTPVTEFTNVTVAMTDDSGTAHKLQITDQTAQPDGTATFNGVWDGQSVAGTLAYDAANNVHLTFAGDSASFDGTLSGNAGAYHLDGTLTGADGNQVHVAGDQTVAQVSPVTDLTGISFALTNDSGAAYQLQIQTQTAQPDGTATFTGLFDGFSSHVAPEVAGTLSQDDAGNIHIIFDCAHGYVFEGTISGVPGAYHLDGSLTAAGVAAIPVTGNQSA
jgi:hypothetical protein